eukprot:g18534.t1
MSKTMKSAKGRTIAANPDEYVEDPLRTAREAGTRTLRKDEDWSKKNKKPTGRNHANGYTRGGGSKPSHWLDLPEPIRHDCISIVFQAYVTVAVILATATEPCYQYWAMISGGNFPSKDLIANPVKGEIEKMKAEGWSVKAVMGRCFAYMYKIGQSYGVTRYNNFVSLRDGSMQKLEQMDNDTFMHDEDAHALMQTRAAQGAMGKGTNFLSTLLSGGGSPMMALQDGAASPSMNTSLRKAISEVELNEKTKAKIIRELRATAMMLERPDQENAYAKESTEEKGASAEKGVRGLGKKPVTGPVKESPKDTVAKAEAVVAKEKPSSKSTVQFDEGVGDGSAPQQPAATAGVSLEQVMLMSPGSKAVHLELKKVELLQQLDNRKQERQGPPPPKPAVEENKTPPAEGAVDELADLFNEASGAAGEADEEPEVAGKPAPLSAAQKKIRAAAKKAALAAQKEQEKLESLRLKEQLERSRLAAHSRRL